MSKRINEDDRFTLEENLHRLDSRALARLFPGVSVRAMRSRVSYRGLARDRWSKHGLSYTVTQLEDVLGCTRRQIVGWIKKDMLAHETVCGIGGKKQYLLVPWAAVDDFIAAYPMLFRVEGFPDAKEGQQDHKRTLRDARPDQWITRKKTAQILECTPGWVYALAKSGALAARMVDHVQYFHIEDVWAYSRRQVALRAA